MAEEKGTGKHPHKSMEEPWPHTERSPDRSHSSHGEESRSAHGSSQGGPASSTEDLKEREYRDKEGNIHHHTHTSKEERKAS